MNKHLLYYLLILVSVLFTNCKEEDKLYITDEPGYTFETVETTDLSNGCKLYHIQEEKTPWNINVIEIDLTNPKNKLEVSLANEAVAWGTVVNKESLAHAIERRITQGEDIVAGINGDFFDMATGMQFVTTVHNGQVGSTGITPKPHSALMVDDQGVPYIGIADLHSSLLIGNKERVINSYNGSRLANYLVVYNSFLNNGNISGANPWGCEVLVELVDNGFVGVNKVHEYKVLEVDNVMDNVRTTITDPSTQLILSGHGTAREFIMNLVPNDIVKIENSFSGFANDINVKEVIGGWAQFVKEGVNNSIQSIVLEGTMGHEKQRHPRSCIGLNQDKTKFYMVAIEGRSDISKGMSLNEMAYFMMKKFNVWDALNFDGGGSSTLMYDDVTVNELSGGSQRATANSLLVLSK